MQRFKHQFELYHGPKAFVKFIGFGSFLLSLGFLNSKMASISLTINQKIFELIVTTFLSVLAVYIEFTYEHSVDKSYSGCQAVKLVRRYMPWIMLTGLLFLVAWAQINKDSINPDIWLDKLIRWCSVWISILYFVLLVVCAYGIFVWMSFRFLNKNKTVKHPQNEEQGRRTTGARGCFAILFYGIKLSARYKNLIIPPNYEYGYKTATARECFIKLFLDIT